MFDQCQRAQPFGFLTVSSFDAEALVDLLELDGALGDSRLEARRGGRPQRTFVFPSVRSALTPLGDVNGMSEDVRDSVWTTGTARCYIQTLDGSRAARSRASTGIATMLLQSSQIVVEEVPRVF